MRAMDSASLYSGESIITKDAMQDREKKDKEREGEREGEGHTGRPEIQWRETTVGRKQRKAAGVLCARGMQGRLSSAVVEAIRTLVGFWWLSTRTCHYRRRSGLLSSNESFVCVRLMVIKIRYECVPRDQKCLPSVINIQTVWIWQGHKFCKVRLWFIIYHERPKEPRCRLCTLMCL